MVVTSGFTYRITPNVTACELHDVTMQMQYLLPVRTDLQNKAAQEIFKFILSSSIKSN